MDETPNLPLEKLAPGSPSFSWDVASFASTQHHLQGWALEPEGSGFAGALTQAQSWPQPALLCLARSFAKPPKQVQTVCECILIMKGYKELNWKTAKGMMSDPNFLRSLMEIDFDSISQSQVKNIRSECREMWEGPGSFSIQIVSL